MEIFRFFNPEFLYMLLLVPFLSGIWIFNIWVRNKKINKAGDNPLIRGLIPEFSGFRINLKIIIQITAFIFGTIMLARPQFGSKIEEIKREGVEIIIALDVSNSMLAEDIQPNRLERAKRSISRLVDRLENDKIGLIVFAGDAYTQIPVTTDYVSAKMFLGTINPGIVPKQGTAISSAIELASNSFSPHLTESKAIIVITDGENHDDDPSGAAKDAYERGITIHTIGIGSFEGVPIPVIINGRKEYLKDHEGKTVITKLDETTLKNIAFATKGKYVRASNSNLGLNAIFDDISSMKQQELDSTLYSEYNDQFQVFAAIMLFLLIIDFILLERKNRVLGKINIFEFKI